jgi:hypothetical protein
VAKSITFNLYRPEEDKSFVTLKVNLKKFEKMRRQFEEIGMYVEVEDVKG